MWKKVALNILVNIGLFISLLGVYIGITTKHYEFLLAGSFGAAVFILLKIRLIKDVRNLNKKP